MAVRIRFRKFYECDTEAERDLEWGDEALLYCIDTDTYYKIYAGDYVEVPRDEIFFTSPIDINKIAISGVPDGTKFLRDDGSWAEGLGGGTGIKILYDSWDFKDPTAAADPSSGNFRLNTASYATVTELYISDISKSTTDFSQILTLMGEGDVIYMQKKDDASVVARYKLTAAPTDNTGWWTLALEYVNSGGALFANNDEVLILFSMAGAGGGHVIWDQNDTPMAQETVLQFKRLDVTAETGKTLVTRPADTFIGTTPPSNPVIGDIWKNSETWKTYTRYDGYWVENTAVGSGGRSDLGFGCGFDGMGSVVLANSIKYFRVPKGGTIVAWSIVAQGTSPTCTLDVWKVASGTVLPTVSNTIMGTKPALATGNAIRSTTMTGWTLTFGANELWAVNVDACANATQIDFLLEVSWSA